jgi:hypothetical protein
MTQPFDPNATQGTQSTVNALPIPASPRLPKEALKKIFRTISGVGTVWGTEKRPNLGQAPGKEAAWLRLTVQSYQRVGVDELRQMYDPVNNVLQNLLVGQRQFTLVVQARSLDKRLEAYDLCERCAYRLRTPTARDLFPLGPTGLPILSLRDIQPTQVLSDEAADERIILVASMDVRFNSCVWADPNGAGEGLIIESATNTGTLLE